MTITTHVLDTAHGRPAVDVEVALERMDDGSGWQLVGRGLTDPDGRLRSLMAESASGAPGLYRLIFQTGAYFAVHGIKSFYPHVTVTFEVQEGDGDAHYHVPLLVSPFGYSTYRGS